MVYGWLDSHLIACLSWFHVIFDVAPEWNSLIYISVGSVSTNSGGVLLRLPIIYLVCCILLFGLLPTFWLVAYYYFGLSPIIFWLEFTACCLSTLSFS
jgi:hypothetical protein